jgi:hypothetical protein
MSLGVTDCFIPIKGWLREQNFKMTLNSKTISGQARKKCRQEGEYTKT